MSHVADVNIKIKDLDCAAMAAKILGGELVKGQTTHKWYGRFMADWSDERAAANRRDPKTFGKCDHAIKFPGVDYEIGLCKEADGSFTVVYDSWGSGRDIEAKCGGVGLPRLKDEYAVAVTTRMLARKGFRVQRSVDAKGAILLKGVSA
jgi:hypothetical protein